MGYRSRAAFKLRALLPRLPQVRSGAAVVDLGCWPGGWLQVLAEVVGPGGSVVGVDTERVERLGSGVRLLELDFTSPEAPEAIAAALARPADAVLSDAAPKLSGVRELDRARGEELHRAALAIAVRVLRPGGALVIKGFPGPESDRFRAELEERFGAVAVARPEGVRRGSREFYWVVGGQGATPGRPRRHRRRGRPA